MFCSIAVWSGWSRAMTVLKIGVLVLTTLSVAVTAAGAQQLEIDPKILQQNTRQFDRIPFAKVPMICDTNDAWYSGQVSAGTFQDLKVTLPNGSKFTCKEYLTVSGYTCTTTLRKKIYVATYCDSRVDGEHRF
jgi:hypothetical protein